VTVDLGPASDDPVLRGVVRPEAGGGAVREGGTLLLERTEPPLRVALPYDGAGAFARRLPAGTYAVTVSPQRVAAATVTLGSDDAWVEVGIPGCRLEGRVTVAATRAPPDGEIQVSWRRRGHDYPAAVHQARVVDGAFAADGLEPGRTYVISVPGWRIAGDRGPQQLLEIALGPDERWRRLDLVLER
jgi:hypothetical protein